MKALIAPLLFAAVIIVLVLHAISVERECKIVCANIGARDSQATRDYFCGCTMPDGSIKLMAR